MRAAGHAGRGHVYSLIRTNTPTTDRQSIVGRCATVRSTEVGRQLMKYVVGSSIQAWINGQQLGATFALTFQFIGVRKD